MRRRGKNPHENPGVRPITKIELDERNHKKRVVLAISLLVVGLAFLGYAILSALSDNSGWTRIEPLAETSDSVADDLVLLYELGASDRSATAERKALATIYTEACIDAYRLFSVQYAFDGVQNLYQVNLHGGEAVTVEPVLYRAFEQIEREGSRMLFAAPFYREYTNLFWSADDGYAEQYDPRKSEEIAAYFAALSTYTASDEHVRLELLGENTVKLVISDAYRAFARENGIETFVDFYWTRNAFAVDLIAERLIENGFTHGTISSYDGFVRSLDGRSVEYTYHLYGVADGTMQDAARMDYAGKRSMVYLRAYRLYDRDDVYYTYQSGERRHPYVDVTDGLCKNATDSLIAYAADKGCADVLLSVMPVYVADKFDENALSDLKNDGVFALYAEGTTIRCNDPTAKLTNIHPAFTVETDSRN